MLSNSTPKVTAVMTCDGTTCSRHGAGHGVSAIQARVSAATPSKWRDALVAHVDADGWIALDVVDGRGEGPERVWAWNHADLTARLGVGEPVALHGVYDVLAVGRDRLSVLVTASA